MDQKQKQTLMATAQRGSIDPALQQLFNQYLRTQLQNCMEAVSDTERKQALKTALVDLTETLLAQPETEHDQLVERFALVSEALLTSYKQVSLTETEINTSFINATGVVMAVKDAIHTVKDIYRVKAFIRGLDHALRARLAGRPQRPLHLVYPACGPFAPLLMPLLGYYRQKDIDADQLQVTLIDLQPGAVKVLNQLVDDLGIGDYIADILCLDVMDYQPQQSIDILVLEALQHGLTREGHLSFARHLGQFLSPDAIMIPERISVHASLNVGQREYVDQWKNRDRTHSELVDPKIQGERIVLGEIFSLSRDKLARLTTIPLGDSIEMIECGQVQVPTGVGDIDKRILLLSVSATTFGEEQILEYDSGITHPVADMSVCIDFEPPARQPDDLLVKSGDRLKFYYQLTGTPGFLPTVA